MAIQPENLKNIKMNTLKFKPTIFTVTVQEQYSFDLLTLEGESPNNTVYFLRNDDSPSSQQADLINEAIENEEWDKSDFEGDLNEFDIDASILDTAG